MDFFFAGIMEAKRSEASNHKQEGTMQESGKRAQHRSSIHECIGLQDERTKDALAGCESELVQELKVARGTDVVEEELSDLNVTVACYNV